MQNVRRLTVFLVAGLVSMACDQEAKDASTKEGDPPSAGAKGSADPAPDATPSGAGMGLKCVKTAMNVETTVYMGVVQRDGVTVTAIRTDKTHPELNAAQAKVLPSAFEFDDGKSHETFIWYREEGKAGMTAKPKDSAYAPGDIEVTYQMARRTRGDCSDWTIDPSVLLLPKDVKFDTSLEGAVDGLAKPQ